MPQAGLGLVTYVFNMDFPYYSLHLNSVFIWSFIPNRKAVFSQTSEKVLSKSVLNTLL